ncbi:MAG: hypothetical protein ACP5OR_07400 [Candidatus Dormibacteria bacterium]
MDILDENVPKLGDGTTVIGLHADTSITLSIAIPIRTNDFMNLRLNSFISADH